MYVCRRKGIGIPGRDHLLHDGDKPRPVEFPKRPSCWLSDSRPVTASLPRRTARPFTAPQAPLWYRPFRLTQPNPRCQPW